LASRDPDIDTVTLSPDLVITSQSIGVASSATGFQGVDGILGFVVACLFISVITLIFTFSIGPVDLSEGTLSDSSANIPTVTDNLFKQGTISSELIGIYYAPTTTGSFHYDSPISLLLLTLISASDANGELTFGGT
jgi:hypothetical protein